MAAIITVFEPNMNILHHHTGLRIRTPRDCVAIALMAVALLAMLCPRVHADVKVPGGIGPVGQSVRLRVVRGGVTPVQLLATAPSGSGVLEYSIFDQPLHGSLGGITIREGENGAKVIYRHTATAPGAGDEFTFRARIPGGRFSLPTKVTIVVVEPRSRLEVVGRLDFGNVPIRGESLRDLLLVNRGNAPFTGEFELPKPFRLVSPAGKVTIPAAGELELTLAYTPEGAVGEASYSWVLQPESPGGRVFLEGKCFAPFKPDVDLLVLKAEGNSGPRSGILRVRNPGREPIRVAVSVPERLKASDEVLEIAAKSVAELHLELAATDIGSLEAKIELKGPYHRQLVRLSAASPPAKLEVDEKEIAALRYSVEYGKKTVNELVVRNTGGIVAFVSASVNPPFKILEGEGGIELAAGEELRYHLELTASHLGAVFEVLKIEGGDQPILVPLRGHVSVPTGTETPPATAQRVGDGTDTGDGVTRRSIPTEYLVVGKAQTERKTSERVPVVNRAWFVSGDRHTLLFEWKQPPGGPWNYLVETEVHRIHKETGLPHPLWIELDSTFATVTKSGGVARAKIKGLEAGGKYTFRLLTEGKDDAYSRSSPRLVFVTAQPMKLFAWFRPWMIAVALVIGVAGYALWQRIRYMRELYGSG
jgi:hypothetical protein